MLCNPAKVPSLSPILLLDSSSTHCVKNTDSKNSEKYEGISAHSRLFVETMSFLSVQIFAPCALVWKAQISILEKTQFWLVLIFWTVMIEFCLKKMVNALFKKTAKFKCLFNPYLNKFMWVSTWSSKRFRAFNICSTHRTQKLAVFSLTSWEIFVRTGA